ncbi:MAG: M23 family metallopeptidase [Gemmatimonadetes bacterium]|nr:M23 family metallopeptidase [Gemmatimonadota bacterium]
MSSPDLTTTEGPDERNLTIIVVPHGELDTRSFVISYTKLRVLIIAAVAMLLAFGVVLAIFFPLLSQGLRANAMEEQVALLERERAEVVRLAQELAKVEEQYERVRQMLGADIIDGDSVPILPPLRQDTNTISLLSTEPNPIDLWPLEERGFITRTVHDSRAHTGLDIAVRKDSYIRAAGGGIVRVAGMDDVYGQYVVIDHGATFESVYGHASRLFVTAGDRVRRGEVIGLTGSTGRSTGPHLHFEIRKGGEVVDPLAFVRQP